MGTNELRESKERERVKLRVLGIFYGDSVAGIINSIRNFSQVHVL